MTHRTISPAEALRRQQAGAVLVDVREPHERAAGHAPRRLCIARAELEADAAGTLARSGDARSC